MDSDGSEVDVSLTKGPESGAPQSGGSSAGRPGSPEDPDPILIGDSAPISEVVETCLRVAASSATVLLLGETGTGKEVLARAIHRRSGRPGQFVAVNCGSVTESLIESELFGHERGAFTGATEAHPGLFRSAEGGTLLLDEIGSLPKAAQHTLLRVLQEGRVRPVGATKEVPINVRVIAATSVPLVAAMERGEFREDLFYRLDVIRVVVPPLRNRSEDVTLLFDHFCARHARHHGLKAPIPTPPFREALLTYSWPGNVRQLQNLTERLVLTHPGEELTVRDFTEALGRLLHPRSAPEAAPPEAEPPEAQSPASRAREPEPDLSDSLEEFLERCERRYLSAALHKTGRVGEAAELAGLSRRTLSRKIKKFGLAVGPRGAEDEAPNLWLSSPPLEPLRLLPSAGEVTIGRSTVCDLVLPFPSISRVHARLRYRDGEWWIEDAGSRNGVLLNGATLTQPTRIALDDAITVDPFRFRVTADEAPPAASHSTTSAHMVTVQLRNIPLQQIVERFRARGHSGNLKVANASATGSIRIAEGEIVSAVFNSGQECLQGEAALRALAGLSEGMCVVSASERIRAANFLSDDERKAFEETHA